MKNILLVYPEIPKNTFWSFKYALKFTGKKSSMPPLGLITVAALFPEKYHLKLIDMNIQPLDEADVQWADAVFVSAMIIQKNSLEAVVEICKKFKTPVIAGGPYPTSSYQDISGVDHFVLGEVEEVFADVLDDLEMGTAKPVYEAPAHPDVTAAPIPRFDLLDLNAYASMAVQYSRGCPFKCEFCDIWSIYGNKPRVKHAEQFLKELDVLYTLGWRGALFVVDDNFIGNKRKVKTELLPALIKWHEAHGHVYRFYTEASINMASDTVLLSLMRDAGFNDVFIGIETPSTDGLKETHKTQNLNIDLYEAIRTIQQHGIAVMAGFILGFDSDSDDIFDQQISFIQKAGIPQAMIGLLTALPGTQLYARLEKEGRLFGSTEGNNTHNLDTNFITKMDAAILKAGYRKVLDAIYDKDLSNYFNRCNKLLDNIGPSPFFRRDVHWAEICMLLRSVRRQPFTAYGLQYMTFILRNLIRHPKHFSEAVTLSIMGHHYHTITQELIKVEKVSMALEENYADLKKQISTYGVLVKNNYREGIKQLAGLWKQRQLFLRKIRKTINNVHVDFRGDISRKYNDVAEKMKNLFVVFEDELSQYGIGI